MEAQQHWLSLLRVLDHEPGVADRRSPGCPLDAGFAGRDGGVAGAIAVAVSVHRGASLMNALASG